MHSLFGCGIATEIISSYIDVKGLVRLDSAFCNAYRPDFLKLLNSDYVFDNIHKESKFASQRKLLWIAKKNMLISSLSMYDEFLFNPEQWEKFLLRTGPYLREFELNLITGGSVEAAVGPLSKHAHNIHRITVNKCSVGSEEISALIKANKHLQSLELCAQFGLTAAHLEGTSCSLQRLKVIFGNMDNASMIALMQGKALRQLELTVCPAVTNQGLEEMALLCPNLLSLGVSHTEIDNTALKAFVLHCPHIVHLDVSNCENITDSALIAAVRQLKLVSLSFAWSNGISADVLTEISTYCADTLTTLYCCNMSNLTALRTVNALEVCTKLHTLSLYFSPSDAVHFDTIFSSVTMQRVTSLTIDMFAVNDAMCVSLAKHCPHLRQLSLTTDVYECTPQFTFAGLEQIILLCTQLELLLIPKEAYIPQQIVHWQKLRPDLEVTFLNSMLYRVLEMTI